MGHCKACSAGASKGPLCGSCYTKGMVGAKPGGMRRTCKGCRIIYGPRQTNCMVCGRRTNEKPFVYKTPEERKALAQLRRESFRQGNHLAPAVQKCRGVVKAGKGVEAEAGQRGAVAKGGNSYKGWHV